MSSLNHLSVLPEEITCKMVRGTRMATQKELLKEARLLVERLERVSVDSIWARRASGHRGALLKWIEKLEKAPSNPLEGKQLTPEEQKSIQAVFEASYRAMEKAAQERLR